LCNDSACDTVTCDSATCDTVTCDSAVFVSAVLPILRLNNIISNILVRISKAHLFQVII